MSTKQIIFSILGLIAVALLVWFVGPLIAIGGKAWLESETSRLIAILVVVLLWMANLVRKALGAKNAENQLAEGIADKPKDKGKPRSAGDARALDQEMALRARFGEAVEVLRKTGKKGAGNLYELPWYVIIGPPGAGKTTALKNSGLKFPLADKFGTEALRGVGGTRDCDWWFTDDAVLLDTAGRYLTQDSDKSVDSTAWTTFLKLLKRYRKRRPINGVFIAISLAELITAGEREREAHVRAIKQRVLELYQELGLRFPVYLMFTKCDLVAGFTEFFDDLGREEREQVWGMTFALDEPDAAGAFAREYDALLGRLNDRLFARLSNERDPQRRGMIYGFPQQMAAFKGILGGFVEELTRGSRFDQTFLTRGVYFTSGTQEGTPIDRVMGAVARSFGLNAQAMGALSGVGRSYFLTSLLRKVVFPEADVVGLNHKAERRNAWLRRGVYATLLLALIGVIAAWSGAFQRNQGYVQLMNQRIAAFNEIAPQPIDANTPAEEILHRLDLLRATTTVNDEYRKEHPNAHELGMYQGDKLGTAAVNAYHRELNRVFVPLLTARIATQINRSGRETDPKYAALKAYVMLGEPAHLDGEFLKAWLNLYWEQDFARSPDILPRLNEHLDALLAAGVQAAELDQNLVTETRLTLNQTPLSELVYARLKRDSLAKGDALVPADVLGPLGVKAFVRKSGAPLSEPIPHFFTYDGYYKGFLPESKLLAARARSESWVLQNERDELSAGELAKLDQDVTALYFSDYLKVWQALLNDLRIVPLRSMDHGLTVLEALSGRNSALRALLVMIDQNTSLSQAPAGLAQAAGVVSEGVKKTKDELAKLLGVGDKPGAAQAAAPASAVVESYFAQIDSTVKPGKDGSAPIDLVIEALTKLYSELDAAKSADPGAPPPKLAESAANRRMKELAIGQPEPLKTWLMSLTNGTAEVAGKQAQAEVKKKLSDDTNAVRGKINDIWTADVLPFCRKAVMNRYPLKQNSDVDSTLKDFGKLFAPGGMIDAFVRDNLKAFIDNTGEPWKWRPTADGIELGAAPAVLAQLEGAAKIRDAYFAASGDTPSLEFAMKALSIDGRAKQVTLDVGGTQVIFQQGDTQFKTIKWPSSSASLDSTMTFLDWTGHSFSRRKDGPWALSRLLNTAKLEKITADRLVATFQFDEHSAQFEIRATSVVNPLLVDELHSFNCPEKF